ncbi:MAG: type II toxin-antitoxin system VapC family toxin [Deltaproteobacteria bacterium]|nr:type II toxin-antitoxin system VapC family toxin [Deltaproteobacteria bacterium]
MAIHDLAALPAKSQVFVDTNIFFLHFQGRSAAVNAFITRIALGEISAYVNIQVLSDLMHKLMMAEAFARGYIARPRAIELRQWLQAHRQQAQTLSQYQQQCEDTLAIGVKVLIIGAKLMVDTKDERANYGLMTGDSLHVGTMQRKSITLSDIVTYDGDFAHLIGLEVWRPMDVV